MEITLISGLLGILGGILSGLVVSILSQRKNEAEIKRLEAETKKINAELENTLINERKEILSTIHNKMHDLLGYAAQIGRPNRGRAMLDDKSDDFIIGYFEDSPFSKFDIQELLKAPDKAKHYQEMELWREYTDFLRSKDEFHNYFVEKMIFLDDEEFLKVCEAFDSICDGCLEGMRSVIRDENNAGLMKVIYDEFKNEFDILEKEIDSYIKSQLRPKIKP